MLPVTVRSAFLNFWRLKASQRYHHRRIHQTCHPVTFFYSLSRKNSSPSKISKNL
nr:unnamed protein product [Callosobruchus chinensis]